MNEPCLCGDPECPRCFPRPRMEEDDDAAYEYMKQKQVDDELEKIDEAKEER